jgi:hypothetical protein
MRVACPKGHLDRLTCIIAITKFVKQVPCQLHHNDTYLKCPDIDRITRGRQNTDIKWWIVPKLFGILIEFNDKFDDFHNTCRV